MQSVNLSFSAPSFKQKPLPALQYESSPAPHSDIYFGTGRGAVTKAARKTIGGGGKDPRKPSGQQPAKGHYEETRIQRHRRVLRQRLDELKQRVPNWESFTNLKWQKVTSKSGNERWEDSNARDIRVFNDLYPQLTPSRRASFDEKFPAPPIGGAGNKALRSQAGSSQQETASSAYTEGGTAIEDWQSQLPPRQETPVGFDSMTYPGYTRTAEGGYRAVTPDNFNSTRFPGQVRLPGGFYRPATPINSDSNRFFGQVNTEQGYRPATPIGYPSQRYPGFWLESVDPITATKSYNPL